MLLGTDIFNPTTGLPDVSQVGQLPGGVGSVSALAGIRSGTDFVEALRAATATPRRAEEEKTDPLDTPPVNAAQQRLTDAGREKRRVASLLRSSVDGSYG